MRIWGRRRTPFQFGAGRLSFETEFPGRSIFGCSAGSLGGAEESDVDFLVELEEGRSLLDLGGMLMDLQDELGVEVDLTTTPSLSDDVKERVLEDSSSI